MADGSPPRHRRQLRWWRPPGSDRVVAKEEFLALETHGRAALLAALKRWTRGESLPKEVKPLGNGLIEIRVKVGNDPFRAILFRDSPVHDVVVLAIYKNQQKLPKTSLDLALKRMQQWKQAS